MYVWKHVESTNWVGCNSDKIRTVVGDGGPRLTEGKRDRSIQKAD